MNFAVFSKHATAIELCLFDAQGSETRLELPRRTGSVWHGFVPGLEARQRYGLRAHGPYEPTKGHRFNPSKLLIDPYARSIEGDVKWDSSVYGFVPKDPTGAVPTPSDEVTMNAADSAPFMPRSVVIDDSFDWEGDAPPGTSKQDSIVYEAHLKGFTKLHPDLDKKVRGTYAGLASQPSIEYLKSLGITAIELLPIHQHIHEQTLVNNGFKNYWGYQSIGYFAPHNGYASVDDPQAQVTEFKSMVKALHRAGIEVWLDVVYNHTAEGNHAGPTLSLKGLDNFTYYRLHAEDKSRYIDYTGVGNTVDTRQPDVLRLILDSLRYWVTEMHIDGFRFDLCLTLGRVSDHFSPGAAFFDAIHQDPVLQSVKLVGEPWDLGPGGYEIGYFPERWSEWNGHYRDSMREFWRGHEKDISNFASCFAGTPNLYEATQRDTSASLNFITAHDGFTLNDLVSYDSKHNEANGHDNTDGDSHNRSWNCGVEGPTDDPSILELRAKQQRNFLTTLLVSQGVPMLLAGDEMGRTQGGNNNAYCQDNEISWIDWELLEKNKDLLEFTKNIIALRKAQPVLRRRGFFGHGGPPAEREIAWFRPDGHEMETDDWKWEFAKSITAWLNGDAIQDVDDDGEPVKGDTLVVMVNAFENDMQFVLPDAVWGARWEVLVDSNFMRLAGQQRDAGGAFDLSSRSIVIAKRLA